MRYAWSKPGSPGVRCMTPKTCSACATTEQLARALDASRAMEVPASSSRDYSSWEYVGQRPRRVPHEDTIDPDEPQIKQARRAKRREGSRLVPERSPCVVGRTYCA